MVMHVFVGLDSANIRRTLISSAVQTSFSLMSFFIYYVNRQGNTGITILMEQMEKMGQNDAEFITQGSRNALDKITFCFQSWNIISEKKIETDRVLKATVYKKLQIDLDRERFSRSRIKWCL